VERLDMNRHMAHRVKRRRTLDDVMEVAGTVLVFALALAMFWLLMVAGR
jgi:hypothetical protein